jgi:hypothetical protein
MAPARIAVANPAIRLFVRRGGNVINANRDEFDAAEENDNGFVRIRRRQRFPHRVAVRVHIGAPLLIEANRDELDPAEENDDDVVLW